MYFSYQTNISFWSRENVIKCFICILMFIIVLYITFGLVFLHVAKSNFKQWRHTEKIVLLCQSTRNREIYAHRKYILMRWYFYKYFNIYNTVLQKSFFLRVPWEALQNILKIDLRKKIPVCRRITRSSHYCTKNVQCFPFVRKERAIVLG